MLRTLMIFSGGFEIAFGVGLFLLMTQGFALGGAVREWADLLAVVTVVLGLAAVVASSRLDTTTGIAIAYGLWLYNVLAAVALVLATSDATGYLLPAGAAIHAVFGLLLTYALFARSPNN